MSETGSSDPRLENWLHALVATPGMTAVTDLAEARRVHVDEVLSALEFFEQGPAIDVGSGGGSPGIPLALSRPDIDWVLLDSSEKKCAFLRRYTREIPNVEVICARAESFGVTDGRDRFQTAVCRALASPPTAIEWCLPLVEPGGAAILYVGDTDLDRLEKIAQELGGGELTPQRESGAAHRQLVIVEKLRPTPAGYPRQMGKARKHPLT